MTALKNISCIVALFLSGCFNPDGSNSTDGSTGTTGAATSDNSGAIIVSIGDTNLPTTTDTTGEIPHTSSDTFTTFAITSSSTSSTDSSSTSSTTSTTNITTTENDSTTIDITTGPDNNLCGNCQIDPGEDCDYCNGLGTQLPDMNTLKCTENCIFQNTAVNNPMNVYCQDINFNYCGELGCGQCEADMACNIVWRRASIAEGYDPNTLAIWAINVKIDYLQYAPFGSIVFASFFGGFTTYVLPHHSALNIYPNFIIATEETPYGSGTYVHGFTCMRAQ